MSDVPPTFLNWAVTRSAGAAGLTHGYFAVHTILQASLLCCFAFPLYLWRSHLAERQAVARVKGPVKRLW